MLSILYRLVLKLVFEYSDEDVLIIQINTKPIYGNKRIVCALFIEYNILEKNICSPS